MVFPARVTAVLGAGQTGKTIGVQPFNSSFGDEGSSLGNATEVASTGTYHFVSASFPDAAAGCHFKEGSTVLASLMFEDDARFDALDSAVADVDTDVAAVAAAVADVDSDVAAVASAVAIVDSIVDTIASDVVAIDGLIDGLVVSVAALPTAASTADAVWEELVVDHSGVSGSTAEAMESASQTVSVTPLSSTVTSGPVTEGATIERYQGQALGPIVWVVVDSTGAAVDLSAVTLELLAFRPSSSASAWSITTGLAVSGAENNTVTLTADDAQTGEPGEWTIRLWNTDDDVPLTSNTLVVSIGASPS